MKIPLLFRNQNFALLWFGQVLSQSGIRMYQIALMWWILGRSESSDGGKEIGIFLVMGALPSLGLVKWIGVAIDRWSMKRTLILADIFNSVIIGIVAMLLYFSTFNLPVAYIFGLFVAVAQAFFDPTLNKALPNLVDKKDLEQAVAFQSSTQSLANFSGAVAGALLIDWLGIAGVAFLNSGTYCLSALCNLCIRFRKDVESASSNENPGMEITDSGWRVLDGMPMIRNVLIGFGLVNFFATPILLILPLYTKKVLSAGPSVLGLLEASIWMGLIMGTFGAPRVRWTENRIRLGAICLFILGLCLLLPGILVNQLLYMSMLFIAGCALGVNNVKFMAYFQEVIPSQIKGRFFALLQAAISFTFPVAYLFFGVICDWVTPQSACLIQGVGIIVMSIYFVFMSNKKMENSIGIAVVNHG